MKAVEVFLNNAILDARRGLTIGCNVNLSSNVSIYTLQHDHRDPYFRCNENTKKMSVEIDDKVWLGSNVIILPRVHISEGAVLLCWMCGNKRCRALYRNGRNTCEESRRTAKSIKI